MVSMRGRRMAGVISPMLYLISSTSALTFQNSVLPAASCRRRAALMSILCVPGLLSRPALANNALLDESKVLLQGKITLPASVPTPSTENAAIYITCRPNQSNNVPAAILDGTRGKSPPVLAARFPMSPLSSFPLDFALTASHLTPEGAANGNNDDTLFWWQVDGLVVSARYDSDGVAATRDASDLVGRAVAKKDTAAGVVIELQGRGLFGKAVTNKK
jgi:hypothetical protein